MGQTQGTYEPKRPGRVAIWVTLGLAASAQVALADDTKAPTVLLLPFQPLGPDVSAETAARTTQTVAAGLERAGFSVVSNDAKRGPQDRRRSKGRRGGSEDTAAQERANQALERASEAIEDAEFGRAARELARALKRLEGQRAALLDPKVLADGYLLLGTAYFRNGRSAKANRALARAVHFDPERRLAAAEYPPIFIRVFDQARFSALKGPRGKVEVRARPGSLVLLDGRNMGQAPLILEDVLAGPHTIRVERVDQPPRAQAIRVPVQDVVVVVFDGASNPKPAGPLLSAVAANRLTRPNLKALVRRGRSAGAQTVLLGGVFRTETAYQVRSVLLSVEEGSVGRLEGIGFDHDFLSAEIETFRLVEDAHQQAVAGLADPVAERPLRVASDYSDATGVAKAASPDPAGVKVRAGAPEPTEEPAEIYAQGPDPIEAPAPGEPELPRAVPKDEADLSSGIGARRPDTEDGETSLWWLWIVAGVVVAGAATGGVLAVTQGGDGDVATVRADW